MWNSNPWMQSVASSNQQPSGSSQIKSRESDFLWLDWEQHPQMTLILDMVQRQEVHDLCLLWVCHQFCALCSACPEFVERWCLSRLWLFLLQWLTPRIDGPFAYALIQVGLWSLLCPWQLRTLLAMKIPSWVQTAALVTVIIDVVGGSLLCLFYWWWGKHVQCQT